MDLEARARWADYSRAKDEMFRYTDTKLSPWWVVNADDKTPRPAELHPPSALAGAVRGRHVGAARSCPPRGPDNYVRPPIEEQTFVPEVF